MMGKKVAKSSGACYNDMISCVKAEKNHHLGANAVDNIILIGMPGAGKSTVGVVLAKMLGYEFLDTDLLIQKREGDLLQHLLDTAGQEKFLDLEADAICSVDCRRTIIAPGGSAVYRPRAIEHLRRLGTVVYLRLSLDEISRRLENLSSRGVAMGPGQTLADLYAFRTPLYEKYAHVIVDAEGQTLEQTLESVRRALAARHAAEIEN